MMQSLFILLYLTGIFPLIPSLPRKYYLISEQKTWSEAQAYCQANKTDLAMIESSDEMLQLQSVAQSQTFTSSAWIGLYNDIKSWRWSFENAPLGSLSYWDSNQPDNHNGNEECALTNQGKWDDKPCTEDHEFICFHDTVSDSRYIYVPQKKKWHDAQSYCRKLFTDLASVRDSSEYSIITKIASGDLWFGLFRDSWKWIDKANVYSIPWKQGQPDNNQKNDNCGYLLQNQVEDGLCSTKMSFFCYSVITGQKQTIRVKIRSEQDVNDSEVNGAILEKIKGKLKENGMGENVTVTWRKQKDGKVFKKKETGN
ncbi:lymphocyte antigen 75-like [Tachysurus fulvidraco]|uniref:lymphocyte antigen 75-like n=1 Tax=Tachysurus fulvidraco TaxID=1234273 RepID=UPI001FEF6664|nr:lymphocyte antigen 75-like [Tachysurus fulvidraco]